MSTRVGVIMNGVTGRMGTNQHLIRSICAIRDHGGVVATGHRIVPEPMLVGRSGDRLKALAAHTRVEKWSTDVEAALGDPDYPIYFDAQTTAQRYLAVRAAIAAGKHIYCEKPVAQSSAEGVELHRLASEAGVKSGVVQNMLWLPGLVKLKRLIDDGFFGKILSVRGEFGYWVFSGHNVSAQRPSWNYRKEDGGGIILDMFCHFSYVLENLFGEVEAVSCFATTHVPERIAESNRPYMATAEDAAYALFELEGGIVAQINASWCTRVRRDDLLTLHVDGTQGSAVAGLRRCWAQHAGVTPRVVWNPDIESPLDYFDDWQEVPGTQDYDNAFRVQWELFLRHVVLDEPFPWTLLQGAKNVLLAEKAAESWEQRATVEVPDLAS
ncbi:MAG: Gfo/Idh/MocA family oxidoreductase [Phycisphaerae bacterium]|nr:Gfo/Idh/MocA family oxidoreductase [Phycisphaerae bacterium]